MSRDRLKEWALVYWPVGLAALIMIPRVLSAEFGLFDDGETLRAAENIQNGDWEILTREAVRGRFRPIYWIQYAHVYALIGANPAWFFLWNTVLFMSIAALTIHIVRRMKGSNFQAAATGLFIVLAGPVIENIYTLSKPELLQILLLLAAVTPFTSPLGSNTKRALAVAWAAVLILAASLTKETSAIMVPISAAWLILALLTTRKEQRRETAVHWGALVLASSIAILVYLVARGQIVEVTLSEGTYTNNLEFTISRLIDSTIRWSGWLVRDAVWLIPLLAMLFLDLIDRRLRQSRLLVGAVVWTTAWILIYLPWEFTVEYYMLPVAIGGSLMGGIALESTARRIREKRRATLAWLALVLASLLWFTTLPNNYSNARQQLAVDSANARMLAYLAQQAEHTQDVVVNIQHENEYVYEIRVFLQDVFGLGDTAVEVFDPEDGFEIKPQLVASPYVFHQPLLAVRMGVVEPTQVDWNQSLAETLGPQSEPAFEWEERFQLTLVDLPRLLCAALPQRGYCASERSLIDTREFMYGWQIFELPADPGS